MNTLITARQVAELAFDAGEFLPPGAVTEADIAAAEERFLLPVVGRPLCDRLREGGYPQLLDDSVAPALAACVRLSVQPMLDIRTGPYGSTAPRSDCFEPADEEQCTARLRALRRRAPWRRPGIHPLPGAHAGEHPEYQPRENIFKRCTIDGNLVQIH
mgnify:FL=1